MIPVCRSRISITNLARLIFATSQPITGGGDRGSGGQKPDRIDRSGGNELISVVKRKMMKPIMRRPGYRFEAGRTQLR